MKLIDPADVSPADLALLLARLSETDPHHELIVAVRLALEIADARRADHRARREAGLDVHGGDPTSWGKWRRSHVPFEQMQARRGLKKTDEGWTAA